MLLKQYIDETQEIDVETTEKIVREPETKTNDAPSETDVNANVSVDDYKPTDTVETISDNSDKNEVIGLEDIPSSDRVSFKELSEVTPPLADAFVSKPDIIDLDDNNSEITNDVLKIGEDVPLNLDTGFDNDVHVEPDLQEATLEVEEGQIDLGIEELTI